MLRAGEIRTVTIEGLSSSGGVGVGSLDGLDVHVEGAFPGELVRARIDHAAPATARAFATRLEVERPHPGRRAPPCPQHRDHDGGRCCGCPLMALGEDAQRELKRSLVEQVCGFALEELVSSADGGLGYRWSSKRVVGGRPGSLRLGSYVRGTHRLADMAGCRVDHPAIVACAGELILTANRLRIEPFDEATRRGDLRYVWVKTDGEQVLLTLITASSASRAAVELAPALRRPVGVAWSVQSGRGNAVRGRSVERISGRIAIDVELAGVAVETGALTFLQPNPRIVEQAYRDLTRGPIGEALGGAVALDLYAGGGVTTALLRAGYRDVRPCEIDEDSAHLLGTQPESVASFLAREIAQSTTTDLVVANPPRAGMGEEVCDRLIELAPSRLHIMSCSPSSLASDLQRLAKGGYAYRGARGYDTLPQTGHVEVVVWLERNAS